MPSTVVFLKENRKKKATDRAIAARPIHYCGQINMAITQRNVGDVCAPDMIN